MKILSNITKINKILLMVIAFIFLIIIAVTAIALSSQNIHPGEGLRKEDPSPLSVKGTKSAFTEIGQIRVFTKEDELSQKTMIILIPWLEYDGSDTAFYEELARKHLSIKNIFFSFFQNHTREELFSLG
ncbi:hypothetical protein, partial [Treponema sp.]|uniref:hypothetical protein n=1 Tax=Treponema sp. TaxID=166 RepID=UPI00388F52FC